MLRSVLLRSAAAPRERKNTAAFYLRKSHHHQHHYHHGSVSGLSSVSYPSSRSTSSASNNGVRDGNYNGDGCGSPDVAVQLDYYMSIQFAGIAWALMNGKYVLAWHPLTHTLLCTNHVCQVA
jgi:hypothetical protein